MVRARPSADVSTLTPHAGIAAGGRRARVREVIVHLPAHAVHLARDGRGHLRLPGGPRPLRLLVEHGQRRLEAVRQVAGLGVRARHAQLAVAQQRIEVADQRLDLCGIVAFEPAVAAFTHVHQPARAVHRTTPARAGPGQEPDHQARNGRDRDGHHQVEEEPVDNARGLRARTACSASATSRPPGTARPTTAPRRERLARAATAGLHAGSSMR